MTKEEFERLADELAARQAESTKRIRQLTRRQKATEACRAWQQTHRDLPEARHVIPHMFLKNDVVVDSPASDDLQKAREFEEWFTKTVQPFIDGGE